MSKRGPVGFTRVRDIHNHFYTICAPCHPWHFFNTMNCFELRQTTIKLYLVHFLGMQSRHWLQEGVVCVVINCLVRQRGSCVTWPCLPACGNTIPAPATDVNLTTFCHVRRCLPSAAATRCFLNVPFPHPVRGWLDVHMTDLSQGWSGRKAVGTLAAGILPFMMRGIRRSGLCNFYITENMMLCGM